MKNETRIERMYGLENHAPKPVHTSTGIMKRVTCCGCGHSVRISKWRADEWADLTKWMCGECE